jgi:hypothetical protein
MSVLILFVIQLRPSCIPSTIFILYFPSPLSLIIQQVLKSTWNIVITGAIPFPTQITTLSNLILKMRQAKNKTLQMQPTPQR